jgi:Tfp pilus assembly ATPase PilU
MILMDDCLFRLWREQKITTEDALAKAQQPEDLAKRISLVQKGMFDDEEDAGNNAKKSAEH